MFHVPSENRFNNVLQERLYVVERRAERDMAGRDGQPRLGDRNSESSDSVVISLQIFRSLARMWMPSLRSESFSHKADDLPSALVGDNRDGGILAPIYLMGVLARYSSRRDDVTAESLVGALPREDQRHFARPISRNIYSYRGLRMSYSHGMLP